jgi:hypothetical protein
MEVYTTIEVITFAIMMLIGRPRPLIVGLCRFPTIHKPCEFFPLHGRLAPLWSSLSAVNTI